MGAEVADSWAVTKHILNLAASRSTHFKIRHLICVIFFYDLGRLLLNFLTHFDVRMQQSAMFVCNVHSIIKVYLYVPNEPKQTGVFCIRKKIWLIVKSENMTTMEKNWKISNIRTSKCRIDSLQKYKFYVILCTVVVEMSTNWRTQSFFHILK